MKENCEEFMKRKQMKENYEEVMESGGIELETF
jgi:hypothetical protein